MNTDNRRSLAMYILSMTIFGTIGLVRRALPLSSGLIAFSRGIIGSLFLTVLVKVQGKKLFHGIGAKKVLWLAVSGGIMGFNWILLFEAYNYTTVSVATLCYYMEPTLLILASALFFRDRLTGKKLVCMLLSLAGMVMISGVLSGSVPDRAQLRGIALGLGAAVLYTCVVMMNKKVTGVDGYEKTVIQLLGSAAALVPYLLLTEDFAAVSFSGKTVLLLLLAGVVNTGVSYALYFGSMEGLRAQTLAIFGYTDPVVSLLLSAVVLSEKMDLWGIIGSVLIIGTALVSELKLRRPREG